MCSFAYFQTSEDFLQTYVTNNSDLYVPYVFDSVWTIALTLNNSMHQIKTTLNKSLTDFTYKDSSMAQILKKTLENLKFQGITVNDNIVFLGASRERTAHDSGFPPKNKIFQDECCVEFKISAESFN